MLFSIFHINSATSAFKVNNMKVLLPVSILIFILRVHSCYGINFIHNLLNKPQKAQSSQCSGNGTQRIVGGEESPEHYPYQISLQMNSKGTKKSFNFVVKI